MAKIADGIFLRCGDMAKVLRSFGESMFYGDHGHNSRRLRQKRHCREYCAFWGKDADNKFKVVDNKFADARVLLFDRHMRPSICKFFGCFQYDFFAFSKLLFIGKLSARQFCSGAKSRLFCN